MKVSPLRYDFLLSNGRDDIYPFVDLEKYDVYSEKLYLKRYRVRKEKGNERTNERRKEKE